MKKSEFLTKRYRAAQHFKCKMQNALACYKISEAALAYNDDQRRRMNLAADNIRNATALVDGVYAEMIGKLVLEENR